MEYEVIITSSQMYLLHDYYLKITETSSFRIMRHCLHFASLEYVL